MPDADIQSRKGGASHMQTKASRGVGKHVLFVNVLYGQHLMVVTTASHQLQGGAQQLCSYLDSHCVRPWSLHLALYTTLWSSSVIAED